mgnify:CR=1 FL=1
MNMKDFEIRYTPKTVDDIVFASDDSRTLVEDLISGDRPFPVREGKCGILLYGIPGTGKSALANMANPFAFISFEPWFQMLKLVGRRSP